MQKLNNLKNSSKVTKNRRRVGRGIGSGVGKTCGRGEKGAGSRSGYKRRLSYEGGQMRLFMKLPIRGFSNARFQKKLDSINLGEIEKVFNDGDTVNIETLREHGFINGRSYGLKILGEGELTKKVTIEADKISASAKEKLQKANISFSLKSSNDE